MRFGQGLIQSLINPAYGQGLFQAGQLMGSAPSRAREAEQQRNMALLEASAQGATERAEQLRQRQQGMLLGDALTGPQGIAQAAQQQAIQAGVPIADVVAASKERRAVQETAQQERAAQQQAKNTQGLKEVLATELETAGQTGYANVIRNVPDPSALPAEVQTRIFESIGMSADEGIKAMSPQGKLAFDMGYIPGTPEFQEVVGRMFTSENAGKPVERINGAHSLVKDLADVERNQLLNQSVVAVTSRGKAGAEALSENAIVNLFGDKLRAEAAVRRFAGSTSIGRRISDSLRMWALGEKTETTADERKAILYAALKQQQEELQYAADRAAAVNNLDESETETLQSLYAFPETSQKFIDDFEKQYREENKSPAKPSASSQYIDEARRRFGNGR